MDKNTGKIICTHIGKGKRHEFYLYKNSKIHLADTIG